MLEVGVQNSTVAVGLALTLLSLAHAVPAIVYSLFVYASALVVILVGRATLDRPSAILDAQTD